MYVLLLIVHVIVCLVLIFVVLLQAGRGGGFSDMLGGGQPQSLFGTQTNAFMVRATEVCAVLFIVTSLSLAILSTHRSKSLVGRHSRVLSEVQKSMPETAAVPAASEPATAVPAAVSTEIPVAAAPAAEAPAPANAQ